MAFEVEYAVLKKEFQQQVERDRAIDGLSNGDCIWAPMMQPPGRVDHVFIGSEPSLKRWAPNEEAARVAISQGFKISAHNIEDFILHFCVRKYLLTPGQTYAVTDLSKGGMRVRQADKQRSKRYERWYDLLKKELALVRKPSAVVWAMGNVVEDFLRDKSIAFRKIIHFSGQAARKRNELIAGREPDFLNFEGTVTVGDIVGMTESVTREAGFAPDLAASAVTRVENSALTDSRNKLIYIYKTEFEKWAKSFSPPAGAGNRSGSPEVNPPRVPSRPSLDDLEFIDNRSQDGCLWVLGGLDLGALLQPRGFAFAKRPKATGRRPAWWTREVGKIAELLA